ncbi:MAG: caspase domain-containing protein [Planctomycetaceae bacterium]
MNVAMLIAVEDYNDKGIRAVKYAKADAEEFGETLKEHGFDAANQLVLIDGNATKSIIESKAKTTINSLTANDVFFLYYAGHGFSKLGFNYLTCHDTQLSDPVGTSIALQSLFQQLRNSSCKKIAMFFDSCESGLLAGEEMRSLYGDLTDDELIEFFKSSKHCVCFAACKSGQSSWPSRHNKHGAWTFNLIEAFKGNAPTALENGVLLTSASLQNYLQRAMSQTLRLDYTDKKDQTPWMYGSSTGNFLLADLTSVLAKRNAAANPHEGQVKRVAFIGQRSAGVRSLSGFTKSNRVPDAVTSATEAFVVRIASTELAEDLQKFADALRKQFRFKRIDIDVANPGDGTGSIITPTFTYSISVSLNPDDPSEVIWHRQVSEIREPDSVLTDEFEAVFDKTFDTVQFSPFSRVDVTALIDRIENLDDDRITVDYDSNPTSCRMSIKGIDGDILVSRNEISLVQTQRQTPKQLLESLFQIQSALIETYGVRLIAFNRVPRS